MQGMSQIRLAAPAAGLRPLPGPTSMTTRPSPLRGSSWRRARPAAPDHCPDCAHPAEEGPRWWDGSSSQAQRGC